ncbi:MAG: hypothetical protein ACOY16_06530 [Chloroflexota bacterium]
MEISSLAPSTFYPGFQKLSLAHLDAQKQAEPYNFDQDTLSPLAQFSLAYQLQELSFEAGYSQFTYQRPDGKAALQLSSRIQVTTKVEAVEIGLSFSAEALGLTAEDFAITSGQPIRLEFNVRQTQIQALYQSQTRHVKKLRSAEEILNDFIEALRQIGREQGGKIIRLVFDEEAIKALSTDKRVRELISELVLMMNVLNSLKKKEETQAYTIYLSGKGKPILEFKESLDVDIQALEIHFELVIYPPDKQLDGESVAISNNSK